MLRNRPVLQSANRGWPWARRLADSAVHWLRRNTRGGSRRNISAHYDLGNDFYSLFLDETMTYSSAVFTRDDMALTEAQTEKYDRLCRKLNLLRRDHVLEIGGGWGGFALHAARHYDCHVTTTTISARQYEAAVERVSAAGLSDRVTVARCDYRDLQGTYDKIVSIEMLEAVGHEYYDEFFAQCSRLLTADGAMALQTILINEQEYDRARKRVDFIKRHIFPGGCLPSIAAIMDRIARCTDMRLAHMEDFSSHYARTLKVWRKRFQENLSSLRALGLSDSFLRLWNFYFCYCEGGFRERNIHVAQLIFHKPLRQNSLLDLPAVAQPFD